MNIAIILCGGIGKRMKAGKNKVFLKVGGKPLIAHAIKNFEESKHIHGVVLVIGKNEGDAFSKLIKKYRFKKIIGMILGGKERQNSTYNGMKFIETNIKNKENIILIFHNGANPFVTSEEVKKTIKFAKRYGACAVANKTKDTIRKVDRKGMSIKVLDRSGLWNMQTPQTIKFSLAKKAFEKAKNDNFLGTDDVSLVERLGKKVKIIEASENNFKITTPLDLKMAELIIKK